MHGNLTARRVRRSLPPRPVTKAVTKAVRQRARDRFAIMPSRLTVLAGPSGVGKGTVVARLREVYPEIWVSVSCTTRAPRAGEVDGVQYRFVTRTQFQELVRTGQLLEWAEFAG